MCTLLVAFRSWEDTPLLVAANRDERYDRPAAPPARRDDGPLPILAPTDLEAGGTWLGLNAAGVFAGITNRFGSRRDASRRSRGDLVLEALSEATAEAGAARVGAFEPDRYNPFHLVVADRSGAFLVWSDGERLRREALPPGIHVVTERSLGAGVSAREALLATRSSVLAVQGPPGEDSLQELLAHHGPVAIDSVCVHAPQWNYGTRSSTLLRFGRDGAVRFLHADGPPCATPYADLSADARSLLSEGGR